MFHTLAYPSSNNRLVVANGSFLSVLLHFGQLLTHSEGTSIPSLCWLKRITGWLRFAETSWGHLGQFPLLKKGHLELHAQDHDEMVFEYPQAWRLHLRGRSVTTLHQRKSTFLLPPPLLVFTSQGKLRQASKWLLCCPKMWRPSLERSAVKIPTAVLSTGTLAYTRSEAFKSCKYMLFLLSSKKTLNQLGKIAH